MELWVVLALLSAIVFAVKDIILKKAFSKKDISPTQVVFEEYVFAIFILLLLFLPFIQFNLFYQYPLLFLAKSIVIGVSTYFYLELLKYYEISEVSPLLNLSPFVLLFFSFTFLGEVLTFFQIVGILLIILGTYFLEIVGHHHHLKKPSLHFFSTLKVKKLSFFVKAALMIISVSLAAIIDRMIFERGISVATNLYFTALFIVLFLFFYYVRTKQFSVAVRNFFYEPQTLLVAALTILSNALVLFAIAIPTALVSLIVPLRRTSTLFTAIGGGLLFHEKHMWKKSMSVLIMLVGVFMIVL